MFLGMFVLYFWGTTLLWPKNNLNNDYSSTSNWSNFFYFASKNNIPLTGINLLFIHPLEWVKKIAKHETLRFTLGHKFIRRNTCQFSAFLFKFQVEKYNDILYTIKICCNINNREICLTEEQILNVHFIVEFWFRNFTISTWKIDTIKGAISHRYIRLSVLCGNV